MDASTAKDILLVVCGGGGIIATTAPYIMEFVKRKWSKADKKEEKQEKEEESAIRRVEEKLDKMEEKIDRVIEEQKKLEERQESILKQFAEKLEKCVKAVRLFMLERLRYLGLCYLNSPDKKIDIDDKEQWRNMHEAYEDIGGNGDLDTIKDEIEKRETKTPKKEKELGGT